MSLIEPTHLEIENHQFGNLFNSVTAPEDPSYTPSAASLE